MEGAQVSPTHPTGSCRTGLDRRWRVVAVFAVASVLAGCSHFGNDMLEITPAVFSECQGPDIVVHVGWNATRAVKRGGVGLIVYKPGQRPVLWKHGKPKGEADTGKWASDGLTAVLVRDNGRLLATRTLESTPCATTGN